MSNIAVEIAGNIMFKLKKKKKKSHAKMYDFPIESISIGIKDFKIK